MSTIERPQVLSRHEQEILILRFLSTRKDAGQEGGTQAEMLPIMRWAEEVKFNDFLKANNEAVKTGGGKRYQTITEAYNDYIAPVVTERTIETEVDKRFKAKTAADSGRNVPGTTPPPATNSNIRHFMKRNATGGAAETTGAGRAAAGCAPSLAATRFAGGRMPFRGEARLDRVFPWAARGFS